MAKTRVAELAIAVTTNADQAGASMNAMFKSAANEGRKFERTMAAVSMVGKKFEAAGKIMSVAFTLPLALAANAATKLAMAAVEDENLFEVSMGGMAAAARTWSEDISRSLGLNAYEVRKYAGILNVMLGSMGLASDTALMWSERMVQMTYDAASFYNVPLPEMFQKIQSGIVGQVKPLQGLGILVDVATVKEYAYSQGIATRGSEMTRSQKTTARLGLIMEQMTKAQGDLARTMDSPTNKLRALTARFQQAGIELGTRLLPLVIQGTDALIGLADAFIELSPGAQKAVLALAGAVAVIGPLLFIAGKLAQSVVALSAAKVIFMNLLRGRVVPAVVAETGSLTLNTAAVKVNTAATSQLALAKAGVGTASKLATPAAGLLGKAIGGIGLGAFGALAGVGLLLYAASKLPPLFGRSATATMKYADSLHPLTKRMDHLADGAEQAADNLRGLAEVEEKLAARESAYKAAQRQATENAWKKGLYESVAAARTASAVTGGGDFDPSGGLSKLSSALSVISDELSIVDARWELWTAEFRGDESSLKFQAAWVDQLSTKMQTLRNAIESVSQMKGKDSEETRELTSYLLDLKTQLAEATKEYEKAKSAMAVPSASQAEMFNRAMDMAGPEGLNFEAAIQRYIDMWAQQGVVKSYAEARAAIFGQFGPIPAAGYGGMVASPGLVEVGDRGPEILDLPRGATITPMNQSPRSVGPFNFYFGGQPDATVNARDIERAVRRVVKEALSYA